MKCDEVQNSLVDYLENNLLKKDAAEITGHINICNSCKIELKEMQQLLSGISDNITEQPSQRLRENFEQMLSDEKKSQQREVVQLQSKTRWKSYWQVAASIALIVSAFFFGKYQTTNTDGNSMAVLEQQKVADEKLLLALIEDQSASKRIQAVADSDKFVNSDTKIIQAIINRLFFDDNTNVRLAAAEALANFSSLEMVKSALIKSLETEKNPSIQIELIKILAGIQEKRALEPMKKLLTREDVPDYVKQELQYNISSLL